MLVKYRVLLLMLVITLLPSVGFTEVDPHAPLTRVDNYNSYVPPHLEDLVTLNRQKFALRKKNELYQMWELANNYRYGTTVRRDPVKALAWMIVYSECLPRQYPGLANLITQYKQPLNDEEIREANHIALLIRNKYHLTYNLTEKELGEIFTVGTVNFNSLDFYVEKQLPDVESLIANLNSAGKIELANKLANRFQKLKHGEKFPIYYGKLVVLGVERPQDVLSNAEILPGGYFIGTFDQEQPNLTFELSGYAKVIRGINPEKIVQNLGIIKLRPYDKKSLANVVGRIVPINALDKINIVLKLRDSVTVNDKDPWLSPVIPITILADGQYYATGLSPEDYRLIISYRGRRIIRDLKLQAGETKGIDTIQL